MTAKTKNKLQVLVTSYGRHKKEYDRLKKLVDSENKEIKSVMSEAGLDEFEYGGFSATYDVRQRVKVDEELLIELLKKAGVKGLTRKVEVLDEDALEKEVFKGNPAVTKAVRKATIETDVEYLTVKEA